MTQDELIAALRVGWNGKATMDTKTAGGNHHSLRLTYGTQLEAAKAYVALCELLGTTKKTSKVTDTVRRKDGRAA